MAVYTTEITSEEISSDNPLHQRLLSAYLIAKPYIKGDLLELGCGEGRGIRELAPLADSYTAIDKIGEVIEQLSGDFPEHKFQQGHFPPMPYQDNSFDTIVTFQVIEHIKKDQLFLKEIARILKPGGTALVSTPNIKMTLSRNPWHIREYTADQLANIAKQYFSKVDMRGVAGSEKVIAYHDENRASVQKIMKYDILNLQYRLPAALLRIPYEFLNRRNRNNLEAGNNELVKTITSDDYFLREKNEENLDLYMILKK
ncbi:MAG: class I SAM-dependent methyltransferase [Cytophagales bacterium]|nr:class I SAM-dependent methyltransferase [Cytophagales bacterium]